MSSISHRNKLIAWGLAAAGALLRLLYLAEFSAFENFSVAAGADISEYHARALELLNGQFFPAIPDIHAPLYSFFLAAVYGCGGGIVTARILQTLLNFAALLFLYRLTGYYKIKESVRLLFLGFSMIAAPLIFHPAELVSESLLLPLFALCFGAFAFAEQKKKMAGYVCAGLCAGLAAATHGLSLAFIGAETVYSLWEKKWKSLLLFLAGALLVIAPVIIAKSVHYKQFCGIQANTGFNIWLGNNAEADGTCYLRPGLRWNKLHRQAAEKSRKEHISTDRIWLSRCRDFIVSHPLQETALLGKKAFLVFHPSELAAGSDNRAVFRRTTVMRLGSWLSAFLLFAGIAGCFLWKQTQWVHPFLLTAAVFAAQVLTVTSGRYRLVMWLGLLLSAALFWNWIFEKRRLYFGCAVLLLSLAGSAFCNLRLPDETEQIEAKQMLGEAAYLKHDLRRSKELLKEVVSSEFALAPAHAANLLGSIAETEKNPALAVACYRQAIKADPDEFEGWMNLANLAPLQYKAGLFSKAFQCAGPRPKAELCFNYALFLYQMKHLEECAEYCQKGLKQNPAYAPALNLYAITLLQKKPPEYKKAARLLRRAVQAEPENAGFWRNLLVAARYAGDKELAAQAERKLKSMRQGWGSRKSGF